ncbi:hypothetical protein BC834DRAFT_1044128, partial [Gloeopeniophorella convolvens]
MGQGHPASRCKQQVCPARDPRGTFQEGLQAFRASPRLVSLGHRVPFPSRFFSPDAPLVCGLRGSLRVVVCHEQRLCQPRSTRPVPSGLCPVQVSSRSPPCQYSSHCWRDYVLPGPSGRRPPRLRDTHWLRAVRQLGHIVNRLPLPPAKRKRVHAPLWILVSSSACCNRTYTYTRAPDIVLLYHYCLAYCIAACFPRRLRRLTLWFLHRFLDTLTTLTFLLTGSFNDTILGWLVSLSYLCLCSHHSSERSTTRLFR